MPYAYLEGVDMRELYRSVRKKAATGLLKDKIDPDSSLGIIKTHAEMTNVSLERVDRELKKGTFILFVKKQCFLGSVHVGKWIAKNLYRKSLKSLMIESHEFSQMLNHEACRIANYWSHFQPVKILDDFLQCTETTPLQVILDSKSHIVNNFSCNIKEFNSDDSLRELVLNQDNMNFPEKLTHLFKL